MSDTGNVRLDRSRFSRNAFVCLATAAFLLWQVLMVPRIIADTNLVGAQAASAMRPLERLAIALVGAVGHGVHVFIWLVGSLVIACLLAVAAWRPGRKSSRASSIR